MDNLPQQMFEPITPRLTALEKLRELWKRKREVSKLEAARAKYMAALRGYKDACNRRDGSAPTKHRKLVRAQTEELKAELGQ